MRYLILLVIASASACAQKSNSETSQLVGGGCEGCDLIYEGMPRVINDVDTSAGWRMVGKKMLVTGVVYKNDGRSPAEGIIVYYHQTNNEGYYTVGEGQKFGKRHGQIRGWTMTNKKGEYKIYTIKPSPYPGRNIPAHIHITVKEPAFNEYYIDDIWFDNDPLITPELRRKLENRGGNGIVSIHENHGLLEVKRDIILGKNIPDYPKL